MQNDAKKSKIPEISLKAMEIMCSIMSTYLLQPGENDEIKIKRTLCKIIDFLQNYDEGNNPISYSDNDLDEFQLQPKLSNLFGNLSSVRRKGA